MATFFEHLSAHGVNIEMALSRFVGDKDLYEICFRMLLDDPAFDALRDSIAEKNYQKAFDAGHALKGVTGNLELIVLYSAVSDLVEALRREQYHRLNEQYDLILAEYKALKTLTDI